MNPSAIHNLRETSAFLRTWIQEAQHAPDGSSPSSQSLAEIGGRLRSVDAILQGLPAAFAKDKAWRSAVEEYAAVLCELKARLSKMEITLKIRQSQVARKRASLSAYRGWADLASHIG